MLFTMFPRMVYVIYYVSSISESLCKCSNDASLSKFNYISSNSNSSLHFLIHRLYIYRLYIYRLYIYQLYIYRFVEFVNFPRQHLVLKN